MAKKKRAKKTKKVMKGKKMPKVLVLKRKIQLVINNLLLFIALSLVSFALYRFVPKLIPNDFLTELFSVMAMVFGFVASGFLIVLLILLIMKMISSKK
ncbi:hypothetical protein COV15_02845 [Candidatus Woesearchaeota archaeon CG10_big_fil_rev_8_21_14_0_10_34_12]|nr:MAG: hypothetical protein COV15_02845 [Candidatus Woesearchaeota archaeon CG10_big_fil_rev_8_21_14_0_10_34_12]